MKKQFLNIKIGSIFGAVSKLIGGIILMVAISAWFKSCQENKVREYELEKMRLERTPKKPSPNDTIWVDENQPITIRTGESTVRQISGGYVDLSPGENLVEVPNRLGVDLTDSRNKDVEFEVFVQGRGWVTKPRGELLKLPSSEEIRIRVDAKTQIWCHYFYKFKNTSFVKEEYRI